MKGSALGEGPVLAAEIGLAPVAIDGEAGLRLLGGSDLLPASVSDSMAFSKVSLGENTILLLSKVE